MALRLSIGQYLPGTSLIHRLDPRVKVAGALVLMVSVFFITGPIQLAFGYACILGLLALARVPVAKVVESIRPIAVVLLVLAAFNLFLTRTGETIWQTGPLLVTTDGVRVATIYSLRLVIAVLAAALMLLTTTPTQLTDAFDACLSPLSRVGLPGHELAMVFSLMLRFIPTIADEAQAILDAQAMRGAPLGEGSLVRRCRAVAPILIALLASSVHHANGLSRALDARCYEGGAVRSHWHPLRMRPADWVALATLIAYVAVLLALGAVA